MSYTHTLNPVYISSGGQVSLPMNQTSGAETNLAEPIPAESTDLVVAWGQDVSQVKSLLVYSDMDLTVKTYNGASLVSTIALLANVPLVWQTGGYYTLTNVGFSGDFTQVKVSNGSTTTAATLYVRCLYDPTV